MCQTGEIVKFFENQTVFLTGGTGLVGTLLLEKLLRVCKVQKIYLLIRPKKGKSAQDRFDEIFKNPCFNNVENKSWKAKVAPISGDCEENNLGINEEILEILKNETTTLIHVAANVKFDQTLRQASHIITTTQDILNLARNMPKLKVLVYVSTAYSNCPNIIIKEDFYPPPMKAPDFFTLLNAVDDDILEKIQPSLLKEFPNTYVYTKCISEDLIKNSNLKVPVSVVRPAIIQNTFSEPIEGWTNNTFGLIGIMLGGYIGIIRSFCAKKESTLDIVPADHTSNCILASAWKTSRTKSAVYNCVGQKYTIQKIVDVCSKKYWNMASEKFIWYLSFKIRDRFWHNLHILFYTILTYMIDGALFILRRQPTAVRRFKRLNKILDMMSYFTTREWVFCESNVANMWNEMSPTDQETFPFYKKLDVTEYFNKCVIGIRLYLMNEPLQPTVEATRKVKILFFLHYGTIVLFFYLLLIFTSYAFHYL